MKQVFLFLFFSVSFLMKGQIFDSTKVGLVAGGINTYFDTVLNIQSYHYFNDFGQDEFATISMGNQGDVRRELLVNLDFSIAPNLGIVGYFKNYKNSDQLPYYNVLAPSGSIRFLTGYTKGQMFGLNFTVNPVSRLNVFIDFQRINSRGLYFNQENKSDQLLVSTSYYTKSGNYKVNGGLILNKAKNLEWGGIADTTSFQDNLLTNRELIAIQLSQSASVARQTVLALDQSLRLVKMSGSELSLFYSINSTNQSFSFTSLDSVFLENAAFQKDTIRDSIRFSRIENFAGLRWSISGDSASPSNSHQILFGLKHFYHLYGNAYANQAENNIGLSAAYSGKWKCFFGQAYGTLLLSNDYAGTFSFKGLAGYTFPANSSLLAGAETKVVRPGLFSQRFLSNNFIWQNEFEDVAVNSFFMQMKHHLAGLKAGIDVLQNYLYFNQNAMPAQYEETLHVSYLEGSGTLPLGVNFYLDSRVRYQITNKENIIRIPNWVLREVLYYERNIFGKAARLQTGVEFNYFSSFVSEAYMPATSVMYLQDDIKIGNFPYFNFLFNFKIKEFTFFLRLENITQGLFKYNYYAAPYYPLPDFNIRMGATWRFFN